MQLLDTPPASPIASGSHKRLDRVELVEDEEEVASIGNEEDLGSLSEDSDDSSVYCPSQSSGYQSFDEDREEASRSRDDVIKRTGGRRTKKLKEQCREEAVTLPVKHRASPQRSSRRQIPKPKSRADRKDPVTPAKASKSSRDEPSVENNSFTIDANRPDSLTTLKQRWDSIYERCARDVELGLPDDEIVFLPHRDEESCSGKEGRKRKRGKGKGKEEGEKGEEEEEEDYGLIIIDKKGRLSSMGKEAEFGKLLRKERQGDKGDDAERAKCFTEHLRTWLDERETSSTSVDKSEHEQGEAVRRWSRQLSERMASGSSSSSSFSPTMANASGMGTDPDLEAFLRDDARLSRFYGPDFYGSEDEDKVDDHEESVDESGEAVDFGEEKWSDSMDQQLECGGPMSQTKGRTSLYASGNAQEYVEMPPTPSPTPPRSRPPSVLDAQSHTSSSPALSSFYRHRERRDISDYIDDDEDEYLRTPSKATSYREGTKCLSHSPDTRRKACNRRIVHLPNLLKQMPEQSASGDWEHYGYSYLPESEEKAHGSPYYRSATSSMERETKHRRRTTMAHKRNRLQGYREPSSTSKGIACAGLGQCRKPMCLSCAASD